MMMMMIMMMMMMMIIIIIKVVMQLIFLSLDTVLIRLYMNLHFSIRFCNITVILDGG